MLTICRATNCRSLFPRSLEGMAVSQMRDYRAELEAEIMKIDAEIEARGGVKAQAEKLFK